MIFSSAFLSEPIREEDNSIVIPLCRIGTLAQDESGKIFKLTEAALESGAPSWKGGNVRVGHKYPEQGTISEAWYEKPFAMGRIEGLTSSMREIMKTPAYMGVSQESIPLRIGKLEMIQGHEVWGVDEVKGTGVSIMLYPERPACPLEAGCGVPIKSEAIDGMSSTDVVYEYDVGKLNNAGRIVKTREIRIWLDGNEANDPAVLKERIAADASYGQMGIFNVYPRNPYLQIGDEIADTEPLHVVNMTISKEVAGFNPHLNTNSTKVREEPQGGPNMADPIKEPTIEELKARIAALEAEKTGLVEQTAKIPELVAQGFENGLASSAVNMKKAHELEQAALELKSCMPVGFDEYMSLNPSKEQIESMTQKIKSANPVGAPKGTAPADVNALYSSGEELYKKLGVTAEGLAKYAEET